MILGRIEEEVKVGAEIKRVRKHIVNMIDINII